MGITWNASADADLFQAVLAFSPPLTQIPVADREGIVAFMHSRGHTEASWEGVRSWPSSNTYVFIPHASKYKQLPKAAGQHSSPATLLPDLPDNMSQSKTWDDATMRDLLVALITTTSVLSDLSAEQKEEVVAFMNARVHDKISWDKIRGWFHSSSSKNTTPQNTKRSEMSAKGHQFSQDWDEPGLAKDLLAATIMQLNPSKQDILQIANKAKALGDWHFTESAC
ncbi:hypothetical protein Daus18300_011302 [Diaporthe australafricana]|uniref:Uncharacterized protein n=1 Tax=Diaporthe australafricana TaxID=127596 RepID=A0ABR3W7G0_9PEZI